VTAQNRRAFQLLDEDYSVEFQDWGLTQQAQSHIQATVDSPARVGEITQGEANECD
jgi:hypothetical protein